MQKIQYIEGVRGSGAQFSPCRQYRYQLWRYWDRSKPVLNVIGLNPSTADETQDDPTIRRCIDYAWRWGYGGLWMTNIFAFRATDPKVMKAQADPVGPRNDDVLKHSAYHSGLVLAAWGTHGAFLGRGAAVLAMLPKVHCLRMTKDGSPAHPLYLPKDLKPIEMVIV
jgi:hypothetical protein